MKIKSGLKNYHSKPIFEELETRQLFSAGVESLLVNQLEDPNATYVNVDSAPVPSAENQAQDVIINDIENKTNEIVFIDTRVQDYQTLLDDITKNSSASSNIEVVLLDADQDGISQISKILSERDNLDAIHIISHGSDGSLDLGNSQLNFNTLIQNQLEISAWGNAFSENGDILLYGCNVAETQFGQSFVDYLASITNTDIAASVNVTGNTVAEGDWDLEYQVGVLEAQVIFNTEFQTSWSGTLDLVAAGGETLVNTSTPDEQMTTPFGGGNVAMDDAGNYVVVWEDYRSGYVDVYAKVYNSDGSVRVNEFRVHAAYPSTQDWANVAMADNGNFVVTWSDFRSGRYETYMRLFDINGTALTGETQVSFGSGDAHAVDFAADGSFVITWTEVNSGDIYFQRFNANGVAQGGITRANTTTTDVQDHPDVAVADDGSFVISWMSQNQDGSGYGMYFQRFNASGVAQGSETRINQTTIGDQWYGTIDSDASGNFVVTWMSNDGNGDGIFARRFDASGTALGNEFRVNTWTQGDQGSPNVAVNDDGDFVITWHDSYGHDGTGFGVYAQHYDASGKAIGVETQIAQTTENDQRMPTVAIKGTSAVFVWSGNGTQSGQTDTIGVFLRRFTLTLPNTAPVQSGIEGTALSYTENEGAIAITSTLSISDVDDTHIESAVVAITANYVNGQDLLSFSNQNGISGSWNATTGELTLIGTATLAQYEAALRSITYTNTSDNPSTATRKVSFTVNDGNANSNTQTRDIVITAVNDAPSDLYSV